MHVFVILCVCRMLYSSWTRIKCRESWHIIKRHIRKTTCIYQKKKKWGKKPFFKGFIIYLLKLMKITLNLKNEQIHNALLHALIFIYIFLKKWWKENNDISNDGARNLSFGGAIYKNCFVCMKSKIVMYNTS